MTGCTELHVFDFDGTLFRSPCPHPNNDTAKAPNFVEEVVTATLFNDGLGWFQNEASLSPPAVPAKPSLDTSNDDTCFYVPSMLKHFQKAKANPSAFVVVMTGREEYFRERVEFLIHHAALEPHKIYLKDSIKAGTVNYKCGAIARLVSNPEESGGKLRPGSVTSVTMYEDRAHHAKSFTENLELLNNEVVSAAGKPSLGQGKFGQKEMQTHSNTRSHDGRAGLPPRWLKQLDKASIPVGGRGFEFNIVMPLEGERKDTYLSPGVENKLLWTLLRDQHAYAKAESSKPKCHCGVKCYTGHTRDGYRPFLGCGNGRKCDFLKYTDVEMTQ